MKKSRRLLAAGALCLTLVMALSGTAAAHGHHGGGCHGGGYDDRGYGRGYYGESGSFSESGSDVGGGGVSAPVQTAGEGTGRRCCGDIGLCAVEGCAVAGRHIHDGVLCCGYPHADGLCGGACCALCAVEGCEETGRHLHDGMVYCGYGHDAGFCDGSCYAPR